MTTFSDSVISEIQNLWGSSFTAKYFKFKLDFKNTAKNLESPFCFWDNCIWIGIVKLSLLRLPYFPSAANMLGSSAKILRANERDVFQLNWLGSDQRIWKRCFDEDFKSSWAPLTSWFLKGRLERDLSDIYMTMFSESVISKIQNLWGSYFFSNISIIYAIFKKCS